MALAISEVEPVPVLCDRHAGAASVIVVPRDSGSGPETESGPYPASALTAVKVLRSGGLEAKLASGEDAKVEILHEHNLEWIGPILFFSIGLLTQNPAASSLAIGLLANHLSRVFRGSAESSRARLEIWIEVDHGRLRKLKYEGPVGGLAELDGAIRGLSQHSSATPRAGGGEIQRRRRAR